MNVLSAVVYNLIRFKLWESNKERSLWIFVVSTRSSAFDSFPRQDKVRVCHSSEPTSDVTSCGPPPFAPHSHTQCRKRSWFVYRKTGLTGLHIIEMHSYMLTQAFIAKQRNEDYCIYHIHGQDNGDWKTNKQLRYIRLYKNLWCCFLTYACFGQKKCRFSFIWSLLTTHKVLILALILVSYSVHKIECWLPRWNLFTFSMRLVKKKRKKCLDPSQFTWWPLGGRYLQKGCACSLQCKKTNLLHSKVY